jgi:drug/metabolite transporter (DMT)-like permease
VDKSGDNLAPFPIAQFQEGVASKGMSPILMALIGIAMGCVLDAIIKYLGQTYSAVLIAFLRYVFGSIIAVTAVVLLKRKLPDARGIRSHAVRAISLTGSAVLFFHALQTLPIAEATVLIFIAPLLIAPLARWLLRERLRGVAVGGLVVGFVGVLVTVQGAEAVSAEVSAQRLEGVASGLCAALLYALSIVQLRQLAQKDDALVTAMFGNVFPALYLLVPAVVVCAVSGEAPALVHVPAFAVTGLAGFGLWFMLTHAYARAPAQRLAATEYSALVWSALLGYVFFAEAPRMQVWAGAAIVVVAVAIAAWDGQRADAAD